MKDNFKLKFNLPRDGFLEPVDLQDTQIGFSVYKEREVTGFKSLFRVYIKDEELNKNGDIKPVIVSASYGKETENGITISSTEFERGRDWPIELISDGEYLYNVKNNDFFNEKYRIISAIDILKQVDKQHLKPTKRFMGIPIRTKLFLFHTVFSTSIAFMFNLIAGLQYLISGEKIHIFKNLVEPERFTTPYLPNNLESTRGKRIKIFEYEVEAWVAALYCSAHLFFYGLFYFYNYKPHWMVTIFTNSFLTTMYGIVSLGLANTLLPRILRSNKILNPFLRFLQSIYFKCAFKKFKI